MADGKISEFLEMQRCLAEAKGWTGSRCPECGHMSLLWSIDELGEVIAIIKKKGADAIMNDEAVRSHFTEECADTFMYLFDMLLSYRITADEFTAAYVEKFKRNMGRSWNENKIMYEDTADKLIIFDMDGVLVDSEDAITVCAMEALAEWGVKAEYSDFKEFTGMGDDKFVGGVAEKYGAVYDVKMKERAYEIYLATAKERVKVLPWTRRLLEILSSTNLKLAVASSSDRVKVMKNLECIGVDEEIFSAVITGIDVERKKPAPDIFLKAAERCGIAPEYAVVCEDATSGVQAAKAAGMRCLAVTTSFSKDALYSAGADMVCDDMTALQEFIR